MLTIGKAVECGLSVQKVPSSLPGRTCRIFGHKWWQAVGSGNSVGYSKWPGCAFKYPTGKHMHFGLDVVDGLDLCVSSLPARYVTLPIT